MLLNHTIGRIVDVIEQYGGDVLNFAGDAVLAGWFTAWARSR